MAVKNATFVNHHGIKVSKIYYVGYCKSTLNVDEY